MARQNEIRYVNLYMAGSAAYELEPVRRNRKAVRLPKAPRQQKVLICIDPLTILGFAVAIVMIVSMVAGVLQLRQSRADATAMEAYVTRLESEKEQLTEKYRQGYDLEEIKKYAEAMELVPITEVQRLSIRVEQPQIPEEPTAWEEFCMFLSGLFA